MTPPSQIHAKISGPIVMIGFGSIGKGTLPLIERHFAYDKQRFVIIDPHEDGELAKQHGVRFIKQGVTRDNYRELLVPLLDRRRRPGLLRQPVGGHLLGRHHDDVPRDRCALYRHRDRAVARLLFRQEHRPREALQLRAARDACWRPGARARAAPPRCRPAAPIPAWCRGSSSRRCSTSPATPTPRSTSRRAAKAGASWRTSSASRASTSPSATPSARRSRSRWTCSSTPGRWKASSPRACSRPNSAGAPTRAGCRTTAAPIPRAAARRSICCSPAPTRGCARGARRPGAQYGFLVTHNESISIADYFTVRDGSKVVYRPTCHYAYHPANDAVLSLHEIFGATGKMQEKWHILDENEIVDGIDELGVLVYGHARNAYWYGSQLSIEETRAHRALPERHRPAGVLGRARRHGVGAGKSRSRHRRGRRDGFPPLPGNPDALSRPGERLLHRLDAAGRPTGPVPRGHRHLRSLAVQERPGAVRPQGSPRGACEQHSPLPNTQPSSPAKAGDPVRRGSSAQSPTPRSTGSSAFADDDISCADQSTLTTPTSNIQTRFRARRRRAPIRRARAEADRPQER